MNKKSCARKQVQKWQWTSKRFIIVGKKLKTILSTILAEHNLNNW